MSERLIVIVPRFDFAFYERLKRKFGAAIVTHTPKVPYRETIRGTTRVEGKYKKQTGGHGMFGHVWIEIEPNPGGGVEFAEKVVGGSVPKGFFPGIEKGIREAFEGGVLAGYPLVDFKVQLIDGSYHTVDSDEHSFRAAGRKAFRAAMEKVKPALLEPIMDVEVVAPQEYSGDIMGDLNSRRGRVAGMEMRGKQQVIKAQVPMSEMLNYQSTLNSITAARGSFHMQFSHYDPVPGQPAGDLPGVGGEAEEDEVAQQHAPVIAEPHQQARPVEPRPGLAQQMQHVGAVEADGARVHRAPVQQLEPAPAVQPKQCGRVTTWRVLGDIYLRRGWYAAAYRQYKTLTDLDRLRVWWAETDAGEEYEDALLSAFPVADVWGTLRKATTDGRIRAIIFEPRNLAVGWGKLERKATVGAQP